MIKGLSLVILAFAAQTAFAAMDCSQPSAKSTNYLAGTPCAPVVAACNGGGYYLGCEKTNQKGLLAACFNPLVFKGASVAGATPQASDISACKTYCQSSKTCK